MYNGMMIAFYGIMLLLLIVSCNDALCMRLKKCLCVEKVERGLARFGRFYWLAFVLCVIAAIAVRTVRFAQLPMDLNHDGAMAGVEAWALLHSGKDHHGIAWPTYFKAWKYSQMSTLYSYVLIPFVYLADDLNPFILRLPLLLFSLLSLFLIWDMARRMLGKNYALLALFIAATNPWQIMQSRWALEANLFPHVFLLGAYFLYIGQDKKWALYLSMVFFALTPYSYGVACFSTTVFLLILAVYYLCRKKVTLLELGICIAIFLGISGPYFYTMLINAFGLETAYIGPFTMPYFEDSARANDLVFGREDPYAAMAQNLHGHFGTYLYKNEYEGEYNMIPWAGTMFTFMTPVIVYGCFRLWRDRRNMARVGKECAIRAGGMLVLGWFCAAVFGGIMIGGVINRNNIVFYPLIYFAAYALYLMGKRMKAALAAAVLMICVAFSAFCTTYFTDEEYRKLQEPTYHRGLYTALKDTWGWDYDRYYLSDIPESQLLFAHKIDYNMICEESELFDHNGDPTGWYYSERYASIHPDTFELDPLECAVYVFPGDQKMYFDEEEFILTDYGYYAVAYPRYWAE